MKIRVHVVTLTAKESALFNEGNLITSLTGCEHNNRKDQL
jgi:hypothetical protein